jgi:hypothetical protein
VPTDGYLRLAGRFYRSPEALVHQRVELRGDRDTVWIVHRGSEVARYLRSYEPGSWLPEPQLRPEPPAAVRPAEIVVADVAPPEVAEYAQLLR